MKDSGRAAHAVVRRELDVEDGSSKHGVFVGSIGRAWGHRCCRGSLAGWVGDGVGQLTNKLFLMELFNAPPPRLSLLRSSGAAAVSAGAGRLQLAPPLRGVLSMTRVGAEC